jgi:hypothetical protein
MIREIYDELSGVRVQFPSNTDLFVVLVEEVGELADALLEHKRGSLTAAQLYKSAIRVAAAVIRVGTEGDSGFPYDPESEIFRE